MWMPILVFFYMVFEHSVVNMFLFPSALMLHAKFSIADYFIWNEIPTAARQSGRRSLLHRVDALRHALQDRAEAGGRDDSDSRRRLIGADTDRRIFCLRTGNAALGRGSRDLSPMGRVSQRAPASRRPKPVRRSCPRCTVASSRAMRPRLPSSASVRRRVRASGGTGSSSGTRARWPACHPAFSRSVRFSTFEISSCFTPNTTSESMYLSPSTKTWVTRGSCPAALTRKCTCAGRIGWRRRSRIIWPTGPSVGIG